MSDKARDNMHMSEVGVHNLELSDYHRLGDTQETTVAMQTKAWLQEMPPNYSAPERGSQPGCPILCFTLLQGGTHYLSMKLAKFMELTMLCVEWMFLPTGFWKFGTLSC
jgi:hypothetical protein